MKYPFVSPLALVAALAICLIGHAGRIEAQAISAGAGQTGSLASFPLQIGNWTGSKAGMTEAELNVVRPSEYFLGNYVLAGAGANPAVHASLYIAYFDPANTDAYPIDPLHNMPMGGWEVSGNVPVVIDSPTAGNDGIEVNRAFLVRESDSMIVYYWFWLRGSNSPGEYSRQWVNASNDWQTRPFGAMFRIMVPIGAGQDVEAMDSHAKQFIASTGELLDRYLPK